jgi:hypothetical protein
MCIQKRGDTTVSEQASPTMRGSRSPGVKALGCTIADDLASAGERQRRDCNSGGRGQALPSVVGGSPPDRAQWHLPMVEVPLRLRPLSQNQRTSTRVVENAEFNRTG